MRIPLSLPDVTEADIAAVAEVLRTSRLSLGPKLEEFESRLASCAGVCHAIAVNSGTSALHLCLRAIGVQEGDEVIVPSFAFVAVANAAIYENAVPVFVDIEPETLNLDPDKIEAAITPRTKAIIAVHTFGRPARMDKILAIAKRHHLFVIEDACEAVGAEYNGQKVGSFGDAATFGFYPNKQITTGEGGAIVTRNPEIATRARAQRNQGRNENAEWLQHEELGYNYRISEMNCALGIEQLQRLETILQKRENVAREYQRRLSGLAEIILPEIDIENARVSWFVYVVRLSDKYSGAERDSIFSEMKQRGIGCGKYFAPIHLQPMYRGLRHRCMDLNMTESIAPRTIAIPFFNNIAEQQIDEVCSTLKELLQKIHR